MTGTSLKVLAGMIGRGEPLLSHERQSVSTLIQFSKVITTGFGVAQQYGAVATLSGYRDGESDETGDVPMFFVIACDNPLPETWNAVQDTLQAEYDDESDNADVLLASPASADRTGQEHPQPHARRAQGPRHQRPHPPGAVVRERHAAHARLLPRRGLAHQQRGRPRVRGAARIRR